MLNFTCRILEHFPLVVKHARVCQIRANRLFDHHLTEYALRRKNAGSPTLHISENIFFMVGVFLVVPRPEPLKDIKLRWMVTGLTSVKSYKAPFWRSHWPLSLAHTALSGYTVNTALWSCWLSVCYLPHWVCTKKKSTWIYLKYLFTST